jgi:hypothetical protein
MNLKEGRLRAATARWRQRASGARLGNQMALWQGGRGWRGCGRLRERRAHLQVLRDEDLARGHAVRHVLDEHVRADARVRGVAAGAAVGKFLCWLTSADEVAKLRRGLI